MPSAVSTAQIPFGDGEQSGLEQLAGASPARINLLLDAAGGLRPRPACSTWSDFPTTIPNASPVIGLYPWNGRLVYVTEDRKIWALTSSGSVQALSDSTAATKLAGSLRPVFASGLSQGQQMLVIAGGGTIQKWQGSGLSANLGATTVGASAKPASFVAAVGGRLVADNYGPTGQVQFSGQTSSASDFEQWDVGSASAGVVIPDARPDPVVAVRDNTREAFAFGTQTTQVYVPDADSGFAPTRTVSIGCGAPYSIIELDDSFAWLDDRRRFVVSNGRTIDAISSPGMARTFAEVETTSDCWGFRARIGAFDLLTWIFPTDGRGWIYDQTTKAWGQWRSYSTVGGDWTVPYIQSYCYWSDRNVHLVGLSTGAIAVLDMDSQAEGSDFVPAEAITGFVDHGSSNRKHCQSVKLQFKRGIGTFGQSPPVVTVSYRDDLGIFSQPIHIDLGSPDDTAIVRELRSQGIYRSRQWKLGLGQAAPFVLANATEQFEDLGV